jgi:signal transduction histidine kinase
MREERLPDPGSMTGPRSGGATGEAGNVEVDVLARLWLPFNLVFAALVILAMVIVLADGDASLGRRLFGVPLVAAGVGSYLWLVRPQDGLHHEVNRRVVAYLTFALALFMALSFVHDGYWFISFVLFFQVWMFLPAWSAALISAGLTLFLWVRPIVASGGSFHPDSGLATLIVATVIVSTLLGFLIEAIAHQSHQRLDLIRELQAERLARLDAEREAGVLAERARLSRDLHDTLAQGFTSIVMHLEAADAVMADGAPARRPLTDARRIARDSLGEVRQLVWALRPAQLRDGDLVAALERMVKGWGTEHGIAATFRLDGTGAPLPPAIEVTLLRVAQEALTNVERHAAATAVDVVLTRFDDVIHLDIRDDGRGFEPDQHLTPGALATGGFGLSGIRERVESRGGDVEIESGPGLGTTVAVVLPLLQPRDVPEHRSFDAESTTGCDVTKPVSLLLPVGGQRNGPEIAGPHSIGGRGFE